jgi:hypothetical protein
MDFLDEIEELLRSPLLAEASEPVIPLKKKRGRPATVPAWARPIREMSPRQLARNDLIEVAQNYTAIVARTRADSLNAGRKERSKQAKSAMASSARSQRVDQIASILKDPRNTVWAGHPNSKLAARLCEHREFASVTSDTLRKDIAKAKTKLARDT